MTSSDFNPKVSIVIPVYNGSNYLREAIDSAIAQAYKNVEVIVVNDGSNDGGKTEKVARSYGNGIRYFSKKNGGVASALNKGIQHMSGAYFSWLSHDDVYYPEKIQKHIKYLEERESKDIVTYCDYEFIGESSNVKGSSSINPKYLENTYLAILSTSIGGCSLLIPKTCFEKVGLFDEQMQMTQDNEMWLRIAKAGFSFEYLPEVLLRSRLHSEQGSCLFRDHHQEERDGFYTWAISYVGQEINSIYDDISSLLIKKRCYKAYKQLVKSRYGNTRPAECYSILKYRTALASYSLMPMSRKLLSTAIVTKLRSILFSSSRYWERRYASGGGSGVGSHGSLALYKAEMINSFVKKHNIQTVIELGCGDGNQLSYYDIPRYIGLDISRSAIERCKKRFSGDESKEFLLYDTESSISMDDLEKADLTLSIDVLYHLVEDSVFLRYLTDLFRCSNQYVIIYSTNFDKIYDSPHQVDRKFTPIIEKNMKGFKLIETMVNPYKGDDTMSDFFVYRKIE